MKKRNTLFVSLLITAGVLLFSGFALANFADFVGMVVSICLNSVMISIETPVTAAMTLVRSSLDGPVMVSPAYARTAATVSPKGPKSATTVTALMITTVPISARVISAATDESIPGRTAMTRESLRPAMTTVHFLNAVMVISMPLPERSVTTATSYSIRRAPQRVRYRK
jgi:hypothetical protein